MESKKNMGIWMDHSVANLIDLKGDKDNCSIHSKFSFSLKQEALSKSENLMHNKEQHIQESFYKSIADKILNYDHVLLFGPTNAKKELHNYLNNDLHFKDIKIDVESADKMTDPEKDAFVLEHFNK